MRTGDRVVIERDERKYPSRGTWPQFRGRTGTVVQTNLGEYGIVFGKVAPRTDGRGAFRFEGTVTWFQPHELRPCGKAPESNSDGAGGIGKVGSATPQRKRISEPF